MATGAPDVSVEILASNTIKGLAMDAVQAADSGHPGAPMGMSDIAVVLWKHFLRYDASAPDWPDRDRVVLSNGHGSMLLYSMLHLTGTSLSLEDLESFRQWGSPCAGHPEFGEAPGIETTTGPLGQGIANGVGMALAERWLAERLGPELVDHRTWVLTGDGCLMEGISHEAASLAGHLGLHKLTVIYDDNLITIDGATDLSFSEDVPARFASYGWHVISIDGHDQAAVAKALAEAVAETSRPTLVCARTAIAKGSPGKEGSNAAHGAALGEDEVRATKANLGMDPDAHFVVPEAVTAWFREADGERRATREAWEARLARSERAALWSAHHDPVDLDAVSWPTFAPGSKLATRKASAKALQAAAAAIPGLLGGSADLAGSNGSYLPGAGDITASDWGARNLHFGIREHAMAAVANGMSLHGGVRPYVATFLVFHDYMRPSVRLAALMHQPVIFVYTHDSVFVGEDGPTHQPIEHLMAMRAIPGLHVVRPADAAETVEAWRYALARRDGPTALCLTRQGVPVLDRDELAPADGLHQGAYTLGEALDPDVIIVATGSEVALALSARAALAEEGVTARVVSMPCWEAFEARSRAEQEEILPLSVPTVSIEAGITFGWSRWVGRGGASVGIDRFGASAPGGVVADKLGINLPNLLEAVRSVLPPELLEG